MFQMSLVAVYSGDEPLLKSRKIHPVTVEGVYCVERDSTTITVISILIKGAAYFRSTTFLMSSSES